MFCLDFLPLVVLMARSCKPYYSVVLLGNEASFPRCSTPYTLR